MSHFVVIVTRTDEDSVESQLEPFYEQGQEGDYFMEKDYYLKNDKDEIDAWLGNEIDGCEKSVKEALAELKEKFPSLTDEEIEKLVEKVSEESVFKQLAESFGAVELGQYARRVKWGRDNLKELVRIKNLKTTNGKLKALQKHEGGGLDKGGLYWVSNPNAKWDWWTIGGRWDGWLVDKNGIHCNICTVGDLDFDKMREADRQERAKYYDQEMNRMAENPKYKPLFWGFEEMPSKEEYVNSNCSVAPYAFLHDGEWVERGEMGWWGMSNDKFSAEEWDKKFEEFIKSLDPETEITIVDCHI